MCNTFQVSNGLLTKHISPRFYRVHFIGGSKSFVVICPSNRTDGWQESRHGARRW